MGEKKNFLWDREFQISHFRRGQLGLGELSSEEEPVLVEALAGIKVNSYHTYFG